MTNYEIFLIREGEVIPGDYYPNVGRVYAAPDCETAALIYPAHEIRVMQGLREYDFNEGKNAGDAPVFTARCVKSIEEIFMDMNKSGIHKAAVVTGIAAIVTILSGCGLPKVSPTDLEIKPGEAWLISMSAYLWQKGKVFEIIGKLT